MKAVQLSPSALGVFKDCPLCFWLEKRLKVKRPRGIFPSLPGGMDRVIKSYMDSHRADKTMPAELEELTNLRLFRPQAVLDDWRNWRTGLKRDFEGGKVIGALDDCLVTDDEKLVPFDYKTKGKPATQEDTVKHYQTQADCYALMLEATEKKVADFAVFLYWSPLEVMEEARSSVTDVEFNTQVITIEVNPERALKLCYEAANLLESARPKPSPTCEYCNHIKQRWEVRDVVA